MDGGTIKAEIRLPVGEKSPIPASTPREPETGPPDELAELKSRHYSDLGWSSKTVKAGYRTTAQGTDSTGHIVMLITVYIYGK